MKKYGEMYVGHWMGKEGRETCYYVVIFKKKTIKDSTRCLMPHLIFTYKTKHCSSRLCGEKIYSVHNNRNAMRYRE